MRSRASSSSCPFLGHTCALVSLTPRFPRPVVHRQIQKERESARINNVGVYASSSPLLQHITTPRFVGRCSHITQWLTGARRFEEQLAEATQRNHGGRLLPQLCHPGEQVGAAAWRQRGLVSRPLQQPGRDAPAGVHRSPSRPRHCAQRGHPAGEGISASLFPLPLLALEGPCLPELPLPCAICPDLHVPANIIPLRRPLLSRLLRCEIVVPNHAGAWPNQLLPPGRSTEAQVLHQWSAQRQGGHD